MKEEKDTTQRFVNAQNMEDEDNFEANLRPQNLEEYIGQKKNKENLKIFLEAAKKRNEPIDHVLLYGPPGLGKTTLAHVIAKESAKAIKVTSGPAIERAGDLASILTDMQTGDILFIDEIHRLNRIVEEVLYPAMEDFALDVIIGKGPGAKTLRIDLPKFTIIGATTKMSMLSSPLRDRFGNTLKLDFYQDDEISQIIQRSSKILDIDIDQNSASDLSKRARKTPRIANRLLKRVRDFAQVKGNGKINKEIIVAALKMLEVDELGLDKTDREILLTILEKYNGGPVGLNTIAACIGEEVQTIEEVYEPFLIQLGFLDRTPRGRIATPRAYEYFGRQAPRNQKLI